MIPRITHGESASTHKRLRILLQRWFRKSIGELGMIAAANLECLDSARGNGGDESAQTGAYRIANRLYCRISRQHRRPLVQYLGRDRRFCPVLQAGNPFRNVAEGAGFRPVQALGSARASDSACGKEILLFLV